MRFSEHYEPGSPDECWIWTGKCQWTGHAKFNLDNTWMQASRIMFYLTEGYFPPVVRHTCDNPPCVNPYHLLGGTQADNLRDMSNRGRARGQNMTHCLRGHPISGPDADVYISKRGQRQCRACVRITVNRRRALYGRRRA
jgi:hypothetical protein